MPVPASLASLSTTPSSNQPSGGENPFPDLDDHLRAGYAFDAQNRDAIATKLNSSAVSAFGLTLIDDADAATARATLGAVGLTGDQTVAGVKTFSSSPVAPTPTTGDNTTKVATTAFVKTTSDASAAAAAATVSDRLLGVNQTWQTVTRTAGQTYNSPSDRSIQFLAEMQGDPGLASAVWVSINGGSPITVCQANAPAGVIGLAAGSIVIPPGSTYVPAYSNTTSVVVKELR